jgi:hypothetical protein
VLGFALPTLTNRGKPMSKETKVIAEVSPIEPHPDGKPGFYKITESKIDSMLDEIVNHYYVTNPTAVVPLDIEIHSIH